MKRRMVFLCGVAFVVMWCGCTSEGGAYYGSNIYQGAYDSGSYSYTPAPVVVQQRPYVRPSSPPQQQVVQYRPQGGVEPENSFDDPSATGTRFRQDYQKMIRQDRERSIREYLGSCGMWGGTVLETRDKYKVAIGLADRRLGQLRLAIARAGGVPDSNSNYVAVKAKRDALNGKLQELDNRIMEAIISKTTGDVARRLVMREEDRQSADAALTNLQRAKERYDAENQRLLNESF